jgi:phenylpropionate dioxygenase-like ring-hydroxylating dioxygenase large terminal subunit
MFKQKSILRRPHEAYYNSIVPPEDAALTHVGPGTPCGEYLRRFWHPVAQTSTLKDLPVPIRILGEDLVLFRDHSGKIGLLLRHCSHRGASLEFGRVEATGIRCCYHGWLFGVDGTILEMPTEGPGTYHGQLHHGAYPVQEFHGLIFAYMGPPELIPPFPLFDTFNAPGYELGYGQPVGVSNVKPCNWLQIMDNVVDPVHEAFLHTMNEESKFVDAHGREIVEVGHVGELDFIETPIGILCQESRRIGGDIWIRGLEYICPNVAQIPRAPVFPPEYADGESRITFVPRATRWRVPMDDFNTVEFAFVRVREGEQNDYTTAPARALLSAYGGRTYEEMQRSPGDYEAQIGQRSIARHALEHLGSTDRGVVMLRKIVHEGIGAVSRGEDPKGIRRDLNGAIPTYGQDVILRAPSASNLSDDRDLIRRIAREVAEESMRSQPVTTLFFRV